MTATVPQMRMTIYDQYGNPLDTIDTKAARSWLVNDVGQCTFSLSTSSVHCTESNLRYGNLVYIQSENLPDWVGVIDTPRGRNYGSITATAYSAEYLFKLRALPVYPPVDTMLSSDAYKFLVNTFNAYGGTQIQTNIVNTGRLVKFEQTITTVYDQVAKIATADQCDHDVTAYLDNNKQLVLVANWYKEKGKVNKDFIIDESNSVLVTTNGVEEQGPFFNEVVAINNASLRTDRIIYYAKNTESINLYGPRSKQIIVQTNSQAYITSVADAILAQNPIPVLVFNVAIDNNNSLWGNIHLGDTVPIRYSWGSFYNNTNPINTYVKIVGMSVEEMSGKMVFTAVETKI